MFLDDWRLTEDGTIYPKFNTPHDLMHDGRWGNAVTANGDVRPEFRVRPGERIRLRLINGANARVFSPEIEGLAPLVIAVDGRPVTQVFELNTFLFSPGNRIDLDITIPQDAADTTFTLFDRFPREGYPLASIAVADVPPTAGVLYRFSRELEMFHFHLEQNIQCLIATIFLLRLFRKNLYHVFR